ncbi:MAG: AAA family ATPase [bacterium]
MDQSEILKAMKDPGFYPDHPSRVEILETYISTLFVTDGFVYKIKKPVNFGFLDFTGLSARKFFCEQEVLLNQRLSPNVYLDVVEIRKTDRGFTLASGGPAVEYAVKMRRLPKERMMDVLLQQGKIREDTVRKIALLLIGFHSRAHTDPEISIYGSPQRISKNTEENFNQSESFVGDCISPEAYHRISDFTRRFIGQHAPLLRKRMQENKIRDGHGDIRMEHICIDDPIVIFDCVEFNRRFRYIDVASDLAFLAMDLDFHKARDLSRHLVRTYVDYTHDLDLLKLIRFYKCYRAYVRGKVESFNYNDTHLPDEERKAALASAQAYFTLADSYAGGRPYLMIMTGLTGTGKTTVAEPLSREMDAALFQSDRIRKELADIPVEEHRFESFDQGIYSAEFTRRTYQALMHKAEEALKNQQSVIMDATFLKKEDRVQAYRIAEQIGVPFFVIEVTCPEQEVERRLSLRLQQAGVSSDGRWEIYQAQKQTAEPVTEVPAENKIRIDSSDKGDVVFGAEKEILLAMEA